MAWSYSSGTLTASGGTESSPNWISDGVEAVVAADPSKGDIVYAADGTTVESCKVIDVVIDAPSGSWIGIDSDVVFILQGASHFTWHQESSNNANDGGSLLIDERATIYVNTNVNYTESTTRFNSGCSCVIKQDAFGVNPRIVLNAPNRHDIITFAGQSVNKVDIQGLNIHQIGGGNPSLKWFLGYARNLVGFKDVTFDSDGEVFQLIYVTANNPKIKTNAFASTSRTGTPQYVYVNNPTFIWTSDQNFKGNIRSAKWTTKNPVWSNGKWDGTVSWNAINAGNYPRFWIVYENTIPVFKASDGTSLQGVTIYFERTVEGTDYYAGNVDEHSATYTETTDATGKVQKDLLDAYCEVSDGTNKVNDVERYNWSCQARHYNYLYTSQYVYQNRIYASENINGTGPKTDTVFMADDDGVTLSQSGAAALTEVSYLSDIYDVIKNAWVSGSYWDIDMPVKKDGTYLNFGASNVILDPNATSIFSYDQSTDIVTLKVASNGISTSSKYVGITTTGNVTVYCNVDDISFDSNVTYNHTDNMVGTYVSGDLHINTGADSTLSFDNVIVAGQVFNDDTAHTLTIEAINGSSITAGDSGTGVGQTDVQNLVTVKVTVKDLASGSVLQGARVYIKDDTTGNTIINDTTNNNGEVQTTYNYTSDISISGHVRKASGTPYYKPSDISGTLTSSGFTTTVLMVKDE